MCGVRDPTERRIAGVDGTVEYAQRESGVIVLPGGAKPGIESAKGCLAAKTLAKHQLTVEELRFLIRQRIVNVCNEIDARSRVEYSEVRRRDIRDRVGVRVQTNIRV